MSDTTQELMDFTEKPTCEGCGSDKKFNAPIARPGGSLQIDEPIDIRSRHLLRKCSGCGEQIAMKYEADSPETDRPGRAGSSLAARLVWKAAKVAAIVAWWAIRNPIDAAAYGGAGYYAMTRHIPQQVAMWAWTAAGLG